MARVEKVAVLGAGGMMGLPIACHIAAAGLQVRGWNRSPDKAAPLRDAGGQLAQTPAQAAHGADVILTMLADVDAVLAVMDGEDGALAAAGRDAIWVQMGTIGESGTESCAQLADRAALAFVDAPVLGTIEPARRGELVVMASGPERLRELLAPLFDAIGKRTLWVGEAGRGTQLKLVTNSWILAVVEGGAEAIALAQGFGIDPRLFLAAIEGGPLDLPYLRIKAEAMLAREFEPSFRLELAAKDAHLVVEAARSRGLDLPLPAVIHDRLSRAVPEHGDKDMSATYLTSAPAVAAGSAAAR